ncbi:DNA topoisomerase 2-binding protein 1-like protein [Leptotrombidium deliense]|uniref:DNA topoisomerase 2-binding protein 1-like protein n=1 Tax=Leptotrombidium deliense TaxID=299467 RepID=A0A443SH04_9ACAR|nr:DNA topoisomerase 2-binding protein 1-like protein [Leptotrombidium deliense]
MDTNGTFYFLDANHSRKSESMVVAFKLLSNEKFTVSWKNKKEIAQLLDCSSNEIFVLDSFDEQTLQLFDAKKVYIIGPNCILSCFTFREIIPRYDYPIQSICMRNLRITISRMDSRLRQLLEKKVKLMGGTCSEKLSHKTTHIISDNVMSAKCVSARNIDAQIMTADWINDCYEKCQTTIFKATSPKIVEKFKLPIFQGTDVCVSQLENEQRAEVKKHVQQNGGVYNPTLSTSKTTHLIIQRPTGDKYRAAKNCGSIHIVSINWLQDSVSAGKILSEETYSFENQNNGSSENIVDERPNECDQKSDDKENIAQNESMCIVKSPLGKTTEIVLANVHELSQLVSGTTDGIFDGYDMLFICCDKNLKRTLTKLVSNCHGFVSNGPKQSVTHVIIGPSVNKTEIDECLAKIPDKRNRFLEFKWVVDCVQKNKIFDTSEYIYEIVEEVNKQATTTNATSDKREESVVGNKKRILSVGDESRSQLISEYDSRSPLVHITAEKQKPGKPDFVEPTEPSTTVAPTAPLVSTEPTTQSTIGDETVLPASIEQSVPSTSKPLSGCVISFSNIESPKERQKLSEMVISLGAVYQDVFSKNDHKNKNIRASTHLIVTNPTGHKVEKALEWNIRVLPKEWLYQCHETNKRENENEYSFKNVLLKRKEPAEGNENVLEQLASLNKVLQQPVANSNTPASSRNDINNQIGHGFEIGEANESQANNLQVVWGHPKGTKVTAAPSKQNRIKMKSTRPRTDLK